MVSNLAGLVDGAKSLFTLLDGLAGIPEEFRGWISGVIAVATAAVAFYRMGRLADRVIAWAGRKVVAVAKCFVPRKPVADGNFAALLTHLADDSAIWDEKASTLDIGGNIRLTMDMNAPRTVMAVKSIGMGEKWSYDMLPDLSAQEKKAFAVAALKRVGEVKERDRHDRRAGVTGKPSAMVVTTGTVGGSLRDAASKNWRRDQSKNQSA